MIVIEILSVITILLIYYFYFGSSSILRKWKKLPPGPIRWPIAGSTIEMNLADSVYPHKALAKMSEKYGPVMCFGFGVHRAVVVSSFDAIKELFSMDGISETRFVFPFVSSRSFNKNIGLIWSTGLVWRDMRRYTVRTLRDFGFGKLKPMELILREETNEIASYILTSTQENNGILKVDLHTFAASAINILWSLVGGYRFQHDDKKLLRNLELNNSVAEVVGHKNIYSAFPFLKTWFPKWSQHERHVQINKEIQQFMKELIEGIKEKRSLRLNSAPENFIEAFLDKIEKNVNDSTTLFTEEQLILILMDLFLAGSESTSVTLNWAILFLSLNPKVQQKLQKELFTISSASPTKSISLQDFPRMPYMKATILEIFRLGNMVPVALPRMPANDIQFRNYIIPKGTAVFLNFHPVFQDTTYWGDPKNFRPERFLNDKEDAIISERAEKISVFSFGKRKCLGETLAWDSTFMYMTTLFTKFTFKPIEGKEPSSENPIYAITIYPRPYIVQVVRN